MSIAQLEAEMNRLNTVLEAVADDETASLEALEAAQFAASEARYQYWHTMHPEQRRCEGCHAFLPKEPTRRLYSMEGDNLDEYDCKRCGATTQECY